MTIDVFAEALAKAGFEGDIDSTEASRDFYSHDASLFEVEPKLVVFPKNNEDLKRLVGVTNICRSKIPGLSLTARGGGTCMSGGPINDSVIVDFSRYFNQMEGVSMTSAIAQSGVFYRNFEKESLKHQALLPSFPASREIATIGGMVANNAGGEKSLEYGKTGNFVRHLDVVLADGQLYRLQALNRKQLAAKRVLKTYEGQVYRETFELVDKNYEAIKAAKPKVTKNSTGYNLWDVWNRETGIFDLTKLFIGAQGTLGLISSVGFKLVKDKPHSGVLVVFMKDFNRLGELINTALAQKPSSFESFDNYTLSLSIKFFPYFRKTIGWWRLIKLGIQLLPDAFLLLSGIPKLVLLIEFTGQTGDEVGRKVHKMRQLLEPYNLMALEEDSTEAKAWKYRIMRRESFNLLRKKVKDKHTAPFIDDVVVPPEHLIDFLPRLRQIIKKYKLMATIAGHMGDGNFHVIPLMELDKATERAKLEPVMREVNELVLSYGGSLSGEHNDGLVRGPWLAQMYGEDTLNLFRQTKQIFDPAGIFNPHKKTDANWSFSMSHIRRKYE
ncbi:MAG: FAD-binding oxidoreductase [Candidatus Saccharimonadales bacterium]